MITLIASRISKWFTLAILAGILAGCSSTPPPAPVPEARRQAFYLASTATKLSQAENWKAAAKEWQKTAESFALIHDRTNQAIAWHNLAQAERERGRFDAATNWLETAANLNQSLGQTNEWWRNQIVLLQVEAALDRTNSLEARFNELDRNLPRLTASDLRGLYFNELAQWQLQRGDYAVADISIQQAQTHFAQAGLSNGLAAASVNRARLLQIQTNTTPAIREWRRALSQYEALADPAGVAVCLEGLGKALLENRDLQAAEDFLERAANNNRVLHKNRGLVSSLKALIDCRQRQNKPTEALAVELEKVSKGLDNPKL
jgi:tetratricopeptide (TPR) repeat protein